MRTTMRRWQLPSFGLGDLEQVEVPMPVTGQKELLVRVAAASLTYRDKLVVEGGLLPERPAMPFLPRRLHGWRGSQDWRRCWLAKLHLDPAGSTPEEYAALIGRDLREWEEIVRVAGLNQSIASD